ncbi:hypothetical protein O3P69_018529 [Scylla paramamosain]
MTVEVKDDTLQFSPDTTPTTTTISIGPGGLSVESSPDTTPLTTPETRAENPDVHPLLVLPMNFGGAATASRELSSTKSLDCIGNQNSTLLERVQSLSLTTTPSHSVPTSPATSPLHHPEELPHPRPQAYGGCRNGTAKEDLGPQLLLHQADAGLPRHL